MGMTIQEAYAAIDAVAKPNHAIYIATNCAWYDLPKGREFSVEFRVSLVPGFDSECDQWTSAISLENVVRECVEAAAGKRPATIETAHALIEEASALLAVSAEESA